MLNIPKVVGDVTENCCNLAEILHRQIIETDIPVSSIRVAEMTKRLENNLPRVNIALANERKILCQRMDIGLHEVINAAK